MGPRFFADPADEEDLEFRNEVFWDAMIDRIREDGFRQAPRCVLDIGCHRGGLLARIATRWAPETLIGIEPIEAARARARLRLSTTPNVLLLEPTQWHRISSGSVDLVVCHEVLCLIPDLDHFVGDVERVLSPNGRAYLAAGCHAENPLWADWQPQLEAMGHKTFSHSPLALMAAAGRRHLLPSVRPLRDHGWATYVPSPADFAFPSVKALLDHQFQLKLLFRLARP